MGEYESQVMNTQIAKELILELFNGKTNVRKKLIKARVYEAFKKEGGEIPETTSDFINAALSLLRDQGLAQNVSRGYWTISASGNGEDGLSQNDIGELRGIVQRLQTILAKYE